MNNFLIIKKKKKYEKTVVFYLYVNFHLVILLKEWMKYIQTVFNQSFFFIMNCFEWKKIKEGVNDRENK